MFAVGRYSRAVYGTANPFSTLYRFLSTSQALTSNHSNELKPLKGQFALVTGAARGVGRGVALELGEAGATVYITGRKPAGDQPTTPTLADTAEEIKEMGGKAVVVYCDHSKQEEVEELFRQIQKEAKQLDILVNNAFSGASAIEANVGKEFFKCDLSLWDEINNVGLRNVYVCSVLAARLMTARRNGLIVNVSSPAGIRYFFDVPYGVGKAAIDRMSADMALELKSYNVAIVSLWPGTVKTEMTYKLLQTDKLSRLTTIPQKILEHMVKHGETPQFVGRAVANLAQDSRVMKKSGCILLTGDLCNEYSFVDIDGKVPSNMRNVNAALDFFGFPAIAKLVPDFLKIPATALHFSCNKFYKL